MNEPQRSAKVRKLLGDMPRKLIIIGYVNIIIIVVILIAIIYLAK